MHDMFNDDEAAILPAKHCAFKGCCWSLEWSNAVKKMSETCRERKLVRHLHEEHSIEFADASKLLLDMYDLDEKTFGL